MIRRHLYLVEGIFFLLVSFLVWLKFGNSLEIVRVHTVSAVLWFSVSSRCKIIRYRVYIWVVSSVIESLKNYFCVRSRLRNDVSWFVLNKYFLDSTRKSSTRRKTSWILWSCRYERTSKVKFGLFASNTLERWFLKNEILLERVFTRQSWRTGGMAIYRHFGE